MKKLSYMGQDESIELVRRIDSFLVGIYRKVPFTYIWIFRRSFKKFLNSKEKITLLDVGCGDGSVLERLNLPKNFEVTGIDIYEPYLRLARKKGIYKRLIRLNVRKITTKEKYDIVLASHILEHLDRKEGEKFIEKLEKIAKKRVIVITPVGCFPQEEYDENPYQKHKSHWEVNDLRRLGYSVTSQGLRFLWGNENVVKKYKIFSYLFFFISWLSTPLLFIKPELGTYMICVKNIK